MAASSRDDYVSLYMSVYVPVRLPLRRTPFVRVVRFVRTNEFSFIDKVHGNVLYTLHRKSENEVLSELIDQGHMKCPDTAKVVVRERRGEAYEESARVHFWVIVNIRRGSLELASTRLFRDGFFYLCFAPVPLGYSEGSYAFNRVFECWKTSKQFLMESEKAASGDGLNPPSDVIKVELYDHQKQGLRWMLDREELDHDELPPFWEECNGVYRCELDSLLTSKRPHRIRGGILADESGMGKTLTLLSLIAYTKLNHINNAGSSMGKKRKAEELDGDFDWRPTLFVCPPSVLATWKAQIGQFTRPGSLNVCFYHGKGKARDPDVLRRHDLVLATYPILAKEDKELPDSRTLHLIHWWRVVLDDAHVVKSSNSRVPTPFTNLKAERRWAVTGKPVHKDSENYNLYPIMTFLQLQPLSDIKTWQNLLGIHVDNRHTRPLRLKILMDIFALRREMPARAIENHLVVLSKDEQDLYNSMEAEAQEAALDGLRVRALQAAVFRLWQSCNSLALCRLSCAEIVSSANFQDLNRKPKLLEKWVTVLQEEKDYACPVCLDQPEDITVTRCAHLFCRTCIMRLFDERKRSFCPLCRCPLAKRDIFCPQSGPSVIEQMKSIMEEGSSSAIVSSKVSSLLSLLQKLRTEDPRRKSIVFSQFRRMLLLLEGVLSNAGFGVRRLDVIDNAKTKAKKVEEFGNADSPVVLLAGYKALSDTTGLDLSAASNIYMMEPCWNAHTEEEALGRIYRLGKKDGVNVVRLVCKNSIEERVLEMRNQKVAYGSSNSKREVNISDQRDCKRLLGL